MKKSLISGKLFKAYLVAFGIISSGIILSASAFAAYRPQVTSIPQNHSSRPVQINAKTTFAATQVNNCKAKELTVKNLLNNLNRNANNLLNKFDSIATRVEAYYTNKVLPSGRVVPNYVSLASDIESKKTAVKDLLASAQADVAAFSCGSNDLDGEVKKIKDDIKNTKKALKEYKESIKILILAILSPVKVVPSVSPSVNPTNNPSCPGNCPQPMPPASGFCLDGTIVPGGVDSCGCQQSPLCERNSDPSPSSSPSPVSSCMPRPKCLDTTPRCLIAEPRDGWCKSSEGQNE